jgi:hypothetical protein
MEQTPHCCINCNCFLVNELLLLLLHLSLPAVGLSNIIVGLSGSGYTGSYIFSQTIFSMRAGVSGYMHGAVIFALEAAIFLVPFQGRTTKNVNGNQ